MADSWFEVAFGSHYPEIYGHRNQAEADLCLELLPQLAPLSAQGLPVLDLGCGDGRHLQALNNAQCYCIGLDLSAPLLDLAQQRPNPASLIRGDMRCLPFSSQSLDSVLSLFTAFGYFGALKNNASMVQEVSRVLSPGGYWFLDYFNCDRVRSELGSGEKFQRKRNHQGMSILEIRRYSEADEMVTKEVHLEKIPGSDSLVDLPAQGLHYTEQVAVFSLTEMDNLARDFGMKRIASAGSYAGAALGEGDRWILVYRKEQN